MPKVSKPQSPLRELEGQRFLPAPLWYLIAGSFFLCILTTIDSSSSVSLWCHIKGWEIFAIWRKGFHGVWSLHILGWFMNIDSDSPSHQNILRAWHLRHLLSQVGRICQTTNHCSWEERLFLSLDSDSLLKTCEIAAVSGNLCVCVWSFENAFLKLYFKKV